MVIPDPERARPFFSLHITFNENIAAGRPARPIMTVQFRSQDIRLLGSLVDLRACNMDFKGYVGPNLESYVVMPGFCLQDSGYEMGNLNDAFGNRLYYSYLDDLAKVPEYLWRHDEDRMVRDALLAMCKLRPDLVFVVDVMPGAYR